METLVTQSELVQSKTAKTGLINNKLKQDFERALDNEFEAIDYKKNHDLSHSSEQSNDTPAPAPGILVDSEVAGVLPQAALSVPSYGGSAVLGVEPEQSVFSKHVQGQGGLPQATTHRNLYPSGAGVERAAGEHLLRNTLAGAHQFTPFNIEVLGEGTKRTVFIRDFNQRHIEQLRPLIEELGSLFEQDKLTVARVVLNGQEMTWQQLSAL